MKVFWEDNQKRSPTDNLAINKLCSELVSNGSYDVIARVYKNKKGVILGFNESLNDVYTDRCLKGGYEVVRRPTGGSAVVMEPDLTLCYSVFFKTQNGKLDLHKIYRSIVTPLSSSLGDNFSVEGNYYLRYKNNGYNTPIAGHAMSSFGDIIQFDGVVHLRKFNCDFKDFIIKTRRLYEFEGKKIIEVDGDFYGLNGKRVVVPKKESLVLLRDEKEELAQILGLEDIGIAERDFISKLKSSLEIFFGEIEYQKQPRLDNILLENFKRDIEKASKNKKGYDFLGHCFVDFIEEESEY